ncbi:MAG: ATP-binding protein [Anaerolineae bacterium]|jgi:signal transduction histidine kinase|nr:ATP-binding protein [Anaerolineae bacterium]
MMTHPPPLPPTDFDAILRAIPDYLYVVEVESGRILYCNDQMAQLLSGEARSAVEGKHIHDFYPPDMADYFLQQNNLVATTSQPLHILEHIDVPNIGRVHVDTIKVPLHAPDGTVYAVLGSSRDMGEMVKMREALAQRTKELEQANQLLQASGGFLQSVLDSQTSSIAVIHTDGTIRMVNATWQQRANERVPSGQSPSGIGQNYFSMAARITGDPTTGEELERGLRALLDSTINEFTFEYEYDQQPDKIWVEVRATRFVSLGAPHAVIAHTNITARKMAELHTAEALNQERAVGELKSRFLSLVSHEFRAPITIIQSTVETLMNYGDRMNPDQRSAQSQKVMGQLKRLTTLIDEISFIYRMQTSTIKLQRTPVGVVPFLRQIADEVELVLGRTGEITFQTAPALETTDYLLDEMLMHQIFSNLMSNAVKYSEPGSGVTVEVSEEGGQLTARVRDRGIGIAPDDQRRLFEPFYRGGNVGGRMGTGLGLSIVEQSVRAHGGTLHVESEVAAGTTFTVTLPV